jgi:hypothetical protein
VKKATVTGRHKQSAAERAARRLLPRTVTLWRPAASWRWALAETFALMAAAIGLSAWLRPADPFWTQSGFPWLWLAPVILALRYGSVMGALAMLCALAGWFVLSGTGQLAGDLPRVSFLGGLILALIAGEFSDVWNARLAQAQAVNAYVDERLHALTHNHFLLSVSHERLEQELIARPYTLREMLTTLRTAVLAEAAPRAAAAAADASKADASKADASTADAAAADASTAAALTAAPWVMQLLAQTCRIESAALYGIDDGQLRGEPEARIGDFGELDTSDPMLAAALESGQLTHVQSEPFFEDDRPSRYALCAPMLSTSGRLLGVLVVARLPFTALTLETLQLVTVQLAYYADSLDHADNTQPVLAAYPRCPPDFALELVRLQRLLATAAIRSSMVAFVLRDADAAEQWFARFDRLRRAVDVAWQHREGELRVLIVLLPLTIDSGLAGYLERIARSIREQYGADLAAAGIGVFTAELDEQPIDAQLGAFLERCRG